MKKLCSSINALKNLLYRRSLNYLVKEWEFTSSCNESKCIEDHIAERERERKKSQLWIIKWLTIAVKKMRCVADDDPAQMMRK